MRGRKLCDNIKQLGKPEPVCVREFTEKIERNVLAIRLQSRLCQQFGETIDDLFVPREAKMRNRQIRIA